MATALDRIEGRIVDILERAKELQFKAQELKKQGRLVALRKELEFRKKLHHVFEDGLSILGKTLMKGRKGTETFVAETHRKAKNLEVGRAETSSEAQSVTEETNSKSSQPYVDQPSRKAKSAKNSMKGFDKEAMKRNKIKSGKPEVAVASRPR